MKTIKIIDLLNKIANGEEVPNEFKHKQDTYFIDDGEYISIKGDGSTNYLFQGWILDKILNDEVEILDEEDEEDEFEDIEEITKHILFVRELPNEKSRENIANNFNYLIDIINQLIKNQKKIIGMLNEKRN